MNPQIEVVAPQQLTLRLPEPADPVEAELIAAYERSRADAAAALRALLRTVDLLPETQRSDGGSLLVGTEPIDFGGWIEPDRLLDGLLRSQDIGMPRVRLMKDVALAERSVTQRIHEAGPEAMVAAQLGRALEDGHTVVFDGLDRRVPAIRRLNELMSRLFRSAGNINGYLSYRPHPGFGAHWDDHEVLIIQLLGHKRWEVHEPAVLSAHQDVIPRGVTGRRVWEGIVSPGDVLYVPRGWGHEVLGVDELTFHLTVTMPRLSVLEVLVGTAAQLDRRPEAYELARTAGEGLPETVPALLAEAATPEVVDRVLAIYRTNMLTSALASPRSVLAAATGEGDGADLWFRSPHPGGVVVGERDAVPGRRALAFARRAIEVDDDQAEVLAPLADGRVRRLADVVERHGPGAAALVRSAIRVGYVEPVADPDGWALVRA